MKGTSGGRNLAEPSDAKLPGWRTCESDMEWAYGKTNENGQTRRNEGKRKKTTKAGLGAKLEIDTAEEGVKMRLACYNLRD
ncbi:hypothetical protein R1flu_023609 [Riccia fluitans]|uniref:Uncharacterized protein n=1 Tax=Riccia fluitans TaxID=41844 RepID=A0ABD1XSI5_9MARC